MKDNKGKETTGLICSVKVNKHNQICGCENPRPIHSPSLKAGVSTGDAYVQ